MATAFDTRTMPNILCCMCGIPIPANPANMCVNCIRNQVDITDGIPKQLFVNFCRGCGRYLNPPNHWTFCELESKELLALCLKKVKGLNKVKLIDAGFIWTEPHSKRLKVKLTIQKEVFTGTILQQVFVVEYVVQGQQCDVCAKYEAKDTWNAVCQVRQRVEHKRTFYWLEQLIIKHSAHTNTINIKEKPDGLDFFYSHKSHAQKMVDFLQAVIPIRFNSADKLVSHDEKSNVYNYKYTYIIEIVPICRDDLVCLPLKLSRSLGSISPLLICYKVSTMIHLVDPITTQAVEITAGAFWSSPFRSISQSKQLVQYVVLDITPIGRSSGKFVLADVQVARSSDFGSNDTMFFARTHLGHILKPGDFALGYDLSTANFNDDDLASLRGAQLPDLFLVRKTYPETRKKRRTPYWRVKELEKTAGEDFKAGHIEQSERDKDEFMRDLEENPDLRSQVMMYKVPGAEQLYKQMQEEVDEDMAENSENFPAIALTELMDQMSLQDR